MKWLTVKNWAEFQHYADRNPTWIKLHRALLDDYEFCALPDHSKGHLVLVWLFASQQGGRVPADPQFLTKKLGLNRAVDLDQLIASGFLIASDPLALGENKSLREQKPKSKRRPLPDDFGIGDEVREWARAGGHDFLDASLAYFRDYATANAKLYADWDAAFRNCVKADWGKAREIARKAATGNAAPAAKISVPTCCHCLNKSIGMKGGASYCAEHMPQARAA